MATSVHPREASLPTATPLTGQCLPSGWQLPVHSGQLTPCSLSLLGPGENPFRGDSRLPCPSGVLNPVTDPAPLTSCWVAAGGRCQEQTRVFCPHTSATACVTWTLAGALRGAIRTPIPTSPGVRGRLPIAPGEMDSALLQVFPRLPPHLCNLEPFTPSF